MFDFLKTFDCTFYFLQELHCTIEDRIKWKQDWQGDFFLSGSHSNKEGIGIFIKNTLDYKLIEYKEIITGRMQYLKIEINEKIITLINLYGPNSDQVSFFNKLEDIISENDDQSLMIAGDFNTVLNFSLDKLNGRTNTNSKSSEKINSIMEKFELLDIWRLMHPCEKSFTWHSNCKPTIFCRLDYFLISSNLLNSTKDCKIIPGYCSDHSLVSLKYTVFDQERGPGMFKLNNSLIFNETYQRIIKTSVQETVEVNFNANPNTLWEVIKGRIRDETIKFSVKNKREQAKAQSDIENNIHKLEIAIQRDPANIDLVTALKSEKEKYNKFIDEKTKGTLLRLKADWIEGAEKNTKYFANLEKKKGESKTITKLIKSDSTEITGSKNILSFTKSFYETLYKKDMFIQNDENLFFNENSNKLKTDEKQTCEGILTVEECGRALREMQNGKSPGSDGITVEFYKVFWPELKQYIVNSLNYSYTNSSLSELQKQSLITLIPKKNKALTDINNWRPISLLNVDYKIASKAIANRIKPVLQSIISSDQTGFIKGRYIGENIRTIQEVINKVNIYNEEGLIFFADYMKAFDSVDHDFMYRCLNHFNFGRSFISWVKLFYMDAKSCVTNNGYMSDFFSIKRGVRQGCPLSPYLFILCIEVLSQFIAQNETIKGISVKNITIKQSIFADDASFFTDGSKQSFENLINTIEKFSLISGLKLNHQKCTVLKLGSCRQKNIIFCKEKRFTWTSDQATTLGITFTNDSEKMIEYNLLPKLEEFEFTLQKWKKWRLSLIGKITVLKTFAWPKLIYPLTTLNNPPSEVINKIRKIMFNFLWDSKPDKISRNRIIQNYEEGGLKMLDIESAILSYKAGWVQRLLSDHNSKWQQIYKKELEKYGGLFFFKCNTKNEDVKYMNVEFSFLKEILFAWSTVNFDHIVLGKSEEILWNNNRIKRNNRALIYKHWLDKGISCLGDIYDFQNRSFYTFIQLQNKYKINIGDYIKYLSLLNSVPKEWKQNLLNESQPRRNVNYLVNRIKPNTKICQLLYGVLIKEKLPETNKAIEKWENEINDIGDEWKNIFLVPQKCTIDTKLREYQYKFLMNIVPNNYYLYKCKLVPSQLCDFCSMEIETKQHLFWECALIQSFWQEVHFYLIQKNLVINLDYKTIAFGVLGSSNSKADLINYIIILAKYFISKNKYTAKIPNLTEFIAFLENRINIERIIAINKQKENTFKNKWNNFLI